MGNNGMGNNGANYGASYGGNNGVGKPPIARSHSALGHIETTAFHGSGSGGGSGGSGGGGGGGDGGSGGAAHVHGPVNLIMGCVFSPTGSSLPGQGLGPGLGQNASSVSRPVATYGGYHPELGSGSGSGGRGGRGGINAMDIAGAGSGSGDSEGLRKGAALHSIVLTDLS